VRLDEPGVVREHDGLHAVAERELLEDVADVRAHRGIGNEELGGDLVVRGTSADEREHLALGRGERVDGARRASPRATIRIASIRSLGRTSFSKKPLAPARIASITYSSISKVVRIKILVVRSSAARILVASTPSNPGIRTSIRITSGRRRRACSTASSPSEASPTSSMSSSVRSVISNAARMSG
jgi:hypothetical protein